MSDIEIECLASIGLAAIVWYCVSPEERECRQSIARAEQEWRRRLAQLLPYSMANAAQQGLLYYPGSLQTLSGTYGAMSPLLGGLGL